MVTFVCDSIKARMRVLRKDVCTGCDIILDVGTYIGCLRFVDVRGFGCLEEDVDVGHLG